MLTIFLIIYFFACFADLIIHLDPEIDRGMIRWIVACIIDGIILAVVYCAICALMHPEILHR